MAKTEKRHGNPVIVFFILEK